ncbi:hypothetical protein [Soonwooa purpurea]
MKKIIYIVYLLFLFSCSSSRQILNTDFIEFNHKNYMVINDDQINIKLIPKNFRDKEYVSVKIIYQGEKLDNKRISKSDYEKIKKIINQINVEDLEMPRIVNKGKTNEYFVGIADGGSNSTTISENEVKKVYSTKGFSKEYHKTFYDAVKIIFETVNIELKNL